MEMSNSCSLRWIILRPLQRNDSIHFLSYVILIFLDLRWLGLLISTCTSGTAGHKGGCQRGRVSCDSAMKVIWQEGFEHRTERCRYLQMSSKLSYNIYTQIAFCLSAFWPHPLVKDELRRCSLHQPTRSTTVPLTWQKAGLKWSVHRSASTEIVVIFTKATVW
jgi:hypothetical protein